MTWAKVAAAGLEQIGAATKSKWYCHRPDCDGQPHDGWRSRHARGNQHPPAGDDWYVWMLMSGRGFGKSRSGAEWIAHQARQHPRSLWLVVAPTLGAAKKCRDDEEAGLLTVLGADLAGNNKSTGEMTLVNGSSIQLCSADTPDRLRGFNAWGAWCDELSSWRYPAAWTEGLVPALRIGPHPHIVVTTTPKPVELVKSLTSRDDGSVRITRGSTWDNAANLAPSALAELRARYEGTRLGRQELEGELLLDTPGALWTLDIIDASRRQKRPDTLIRVVIAVDPAVTSGEDSDETGIVVCGLDETGHGWVLEDLTCRATPDAVARRVVDAYRRWMADRIVGEVNNGGDYIGTLIHTVDADAPYSTVRASRGKVLRAEPVAAAYEQQRVHHVGVYETLEAQMCAMVPGIDLDHDDRLDAMVYGMTELGLAGAGMTWEQVYAEPAAKTSSGDEPVEVDSWASVYGQ